MSETYTCPENLELLNALTILFPDSTKTTLRSWVTLNRVYIDGILAKSLKCKVLKGQIITIGTKARLVENVLPILYSDDHLVVIDKPEGLLSVSTAFEKTETAFAYLKRKYYPKPVYVVHRLDQETSGVMVFALSEKCQEGLKKIFEAHDLQRRYTAIIKGVLPEDKGTWECRLFENANYVVKVTRDVAKGEIAITHYEVKSRNKGYSWLELTLETGKKNQIRVHCQEAGFPVIGDKKYGSECNPLKRLGLHAHYLAFVHPITNKKMQFTSPIPNSFYKLMNLPVGEKFLET